MQLDHILSILLLIIIFFSLRSHATISVNLLYALNFLYFFKLSFYFFVYNKHNIMALKFLGVTLRYITPVKYTKLHHHHPYSNLP